MTVSLSTDLLRARDTHANRPAATAVPGGALYSCSTHNLVYRSDGSAWSTWAAILPPGGTTGQVPAKASGTDYDIAWADQTGSGSGSTVKDPRWALQAGETTIDEFNDASIAGAWARLDDATVAPAANCTWTEGGDVIVAKRTSAGNNTGNAKNYLLRAIGTAPATGDAWITCLKTFTRNANYAMAGLVISDGNTYGAGKQVIGRSYIGTSGSPFQIQDIIAQTNMNTEGTEISTGDINPAPIGSEVYLRLVYKGSSQWRLDFSLEGVVWVLGPSLLTVSSFTPAYVGIWDSDSATATKHVTAFQFLRRVSGVS